MALLTLMSTTGLNAPANAAPPSAGPATTSAAAPATPRRSADAVPAITGHGIAVRPEVHHDTSAPLRSMHPTFTRTRAHGIRHAGTAGLHRRDLVISAPDTSGQRAGKRAIPSTSADFAGLQDLDGVQPPDTQGAAGPTQYLEVVNSHLAVYSKTGGTLLAPETTNTLWSGFGGGCEQNNDGDAVVLYDALSGHWVVSQFSVSTLPYLECVAVSAGTDATGSWHRYAFQTPAQDGAGNGFADYPKMGVWPGAYYTTFNLFNAAGSAGQGSQVCAYDRAAMIAGQAAAQQCAQVVGPNPAPLDDDTVLPASVEGATAPPSGSPEWLASIPQSTSAQHTLLTWSYHVDWATPANTTLSAPTTLNVDPYTEPCFNVRTCVPQGGTSQRVDAVADRLMARLSYRNLGTRQSLVVDHAVVSGASIGMRWYELAPSGGALSLVQQGTVAPDANYRWMGSITQDKAGDIAMGYSSSSASMAPQIRYTGHLPTDPAGSMPQGEATVALNAAAAQTSGSRWGDYTSMTVDPTDDCTFWYANQFGTSRGDWATQIASFKFPNCGATGGGGALTNGGFETGTLTGWTATGPATSVTTTSPHSGTYAALLGSTTTPTNGASSIAQTFTAPTGSSKLSFWYDVACPDTVTYDWATATLKDNTAGTTTTVLAKTCVSNSGWKQVTASITAGHSYTLTLTSKDDNYAGDPTSTTYDDVTVS